MTNEYLLGRHVNISHGFISSIKYAKDCGMTFFQIFLTNPQSFNAPRHSDDELTTFKEELINHQMNVIIHSSFMLNFCNQTDPSKYGAALNLLINDINDSVKCGANGVIVHMGKSLQIDNDIAINNYISGIRTCLEQTPEGTIIFETAAGQGTEICRSIIALGDLFSRFTPNERQRLGFCLDTCHMYAAGYDLSDCEFIDILYDVIAIHLGWHNVKCIHLNDSKGCVGSCIDRHADLGSGKIGIDGLQYFVNKCFKHRIPIILETPMDTDNIPNSQIGMVKLWWEGYQKDENL